MPTRLAKHSHLLMEENPDGTINVYNCVLTNPGVSRETAGHILLQAQQAAPPPAPGAGTFPSRFGPIGSPIAAAPAPVALPDPFRTECHTVVTDTDWEKDAKKYRPSKGRVIWGGGLDVRATDPRLFFVAIPKKRGGDDPELAAHGYNSADARALAVKLFQGAKPRGISAGAANHWHAHIRELAGNYFLFALSSMTKMTPASSTVEGVKSHRMLLGSRGVNLVLGDPESPRARKVLTPAADLVPMLTAVGVTEDAAKILK